MKRLFIIFILGLLLLTPLVVAAEEELDFAVFGLEAEKLLNLGSGILATILCVLTAKAYKRTPNNRLKFVSISFLLFAINGYLTSLELFGISWDWVDPLSSIINFAIILSFFYGVIKK